MSARQAPRLGALPGSESRGSLTESVASTALRASPIIGRFRARGRSAAPGTVPEPLTRQATSRVVLAARLRAAPGKRRVPHWPSRTPVARLRPSTGSEAAECQGMIGPSRM
eukprot:755364-Hanusia_phi.AAC.1